MSTVRMATQAQYFAAFPQPRCVYGSKAFIDVNADKAQAIRYFISYDQNDSPRMGIALGYSHGQWLAPFSAPFAEIAYTKVPRLERVYDFISELTDLLQPSPLHITLPPAFYDPQPLACLHGVLANFADRVVWEYNYYYDLSQTGSFTDHLTRAARKNYNQAIRHPFTFAKTDDIARAYAVIQANRESHGYPLAMTLDQVIKTVSPGPGSVCADFFVMSLEMGQPSPADTEKAAEEMATPSPADTEKAAGTVDVAAAMVYHVAPGIAHVIYWGDAPGFSHLRPMNLFPAYLFDYYRKAGFHTVDIGPSSTDGIPNQGLCAFKESLGCLLSLRPTLSFNS